MKLLTKSKDENTGLGIIERASYGAGNLGSALVFCVMSSFLMYYYTDALALNSAIIGTIMLITRVFDGISDLVMGRILDRTQSKFGKGRLWILRSCIPYAVCCVLLFAVPQNAGAVVKYVYVFITYNLVNTITYTILQVAYNSLCVTITRNTYERGLLSVASIICSTIANLSVSAYTLRIVAKFGGDADAWTKTVLIYACIGLIMHFICIFGVKERVIPEAEISTKSGGEVSAAEGFKILLHNTWWVKHLLTYILYWILQMSIASSFVYYTESVMGNADYYAVLANCKNVPQMLSLLFLFLPLKKFGKGNVYKAGITLGLVSLLIQVVAGTNFYAMCVACACRGVGFGTMSACAIPMNADMLDFSEWKSNVKLVGIGVAGLSFAQKVGSGLGSAITGYFLEIGGYNGTQAVQTAKAVMSIRVCHTYFPLVALLIVAAVMFRYDLDKKMPTITKELQDRNNQEKSAE